MEALRSRIPTSHCLPCDGPATKPDVNQENPETRKSGANIKGRHEVRHELSVAFLFRQDRSLSTPASPRDGAIDADAGGKAEPRAAAAERGILRAARHAGRIDHRGGLARGGDSLRQS